MSSAQTEIKPPSVSSVTISGTPLPVTNPKNATETWIDSPEQTAPGAGGVLASRKVSSGKSGFIYGFYIDTQEANDFLINWTSSTKAKSRRITFGAKGLTIFTDTIPLNEGTPADALSTITITNVTAGAPAAIYQATFLYAEV